MCGPTSCGAAADVGGAAENEEARRPVPRRVEDAGRRIALHLEGVHGDATVASEPSNVP